MQIKEKQKDKRNRSFIIKSDNKQDDNFNNGRQKTNEMAEAIINELQDGKIVDNERIIALLDIFLNDKKISPMAIALLKKKYTNIFDIPIKDDFLEKAMNFANELIYIRVNDEMYTIVMKQADNFCLFVRGNLEENLRNDQMINDEDMKTLFSMVPGGLNSYETFKFTLAKQKGTDDFLNKLLDLRVSQGVHLLLVKQRLLWDNFIEKKLKDLDNGQMLDDKDMKTLFSMLPGSSALYKKYQKILNEKDTQQAVNFINELRTQISNDNIFNIVSLQFCNFGIILPAEIRPSVLGNLIVPENSNIIEYRKNSTLIDILIQSFNELVIKPYEECKKDLLIYLNGENEKLKDENIENKFYEYFYEEPSIEELKEVLNSKKIVEYFNDIIQIDLPVLADKGVDTSNKTKMMTPDEFNNRDFAIEELRLSFRAIRSSFPPDEDLMKIAKCVYLLDTIKGREPFINAPFYNLTGIFNYMYTAESVDKIILKYHRNDLTMFLTRMARPLFIHKPCIADIRQNEISNSHITAALISLVNSSKYGPNFIMNMMRDNQDGTVTVKLYATKYLVNNKNENVVHIEPTLIKVPKHGLFDECSTDLWVQILMQAYTILKMNLENDNQKNIITTKDIQNEPLHYVLMSFTGKIAYCYSNSSIKKQNYMFINKYDNPPEYLIKCALNKNSPVTVCFRNNLKTQFSDYKILAYNDYPIVNMLEDKTLILRDPQEGNSLIYSPPLGAIKDSIQSIYIGEKI